VRQMQASTHCFSLICSCMHTWISPLSNTDSPTLHPSNFCFSHCAMHNWHCESSQPGHLLHG
jgi:hypothetical protein